MTRFNREEASLYKETSAHPTSKIENMTRPERKLGETILCLRRCLGLISIHYPETFILSKRSHIIGRILCSVWIIFDQVLEESAIKCRVFKKRQVKTKCKHQFVLTTSG